MSETLNFEIQWYDPDKQKWNTQEAGSATFAKIQEDWQWWTTPRPDVGHYRLVLIVRQEIVLEERGK